MTPERIAELRRLAEAATPGPWATDLCDHSQVIAAEVAVVAECLLLDNDAAFIAAANPATALELLAEIERLRRDIDISVHECDAMLGERELLYRDADKLRADLALARKVLAERVEMMQGYYCGTNILVCPVCGARGPRDGQPEHLPDCEWLRAMGRTT